MRTVYFRKNGELRKYECEPFASVQDIIDTCNQMGAQSAVMVVVK